MQVCLQSGTIINATGSSIGISGMTFPITVYGHVILKNCQVIYVKSSPFGDGREIRVIAINEDVKGHHGGPVATETMEDLTFDEWFALHQLEGKDGR
jgi:hypothetical protein